MSLRQILESQKSLKLRSGLSELELREFQGTLPGPIPPDMESVLRFAGGFKSDALDIVDFTGRSHEWEFKELVPYGFAVAKTGEGNFWVLDVKEDGSWAHVFYVSHDPPVFSIHFNSLESFVKAVIEGERIIREVSSLTWQDHSRGIPVPAARSSQDPKLAQFARSLPDDFRIFDLRGTDAPRGFEWGQAGPWTQCKRFGLELIFAVEDPKPKKGILSRLLGK